jgi:predicted regulator of Ras-like GTPase activity (Roadblock/LC7/MglB family)
VNSKGASERKLLRDRPESTFSLILGRFLQHHEEVIAAVLVDADGECVDYAAVCDPYDAKIFGAALLGTTAAITASSRRMGAGAPVQWVLEATRYDLLARRISDDFVLVVVLTAPGLKGHVLLAMAALAEALRTEAGLTPETWDPASVPFRVETRHVEGTDVPERLFVGGQVLRVEQILGRWTERGAISSAARVCFRVRAGQRELTVVYEPELASWYRR